MTTAQITTAPVASIVLTSDDVTASAIVSVIRAAVRAGSKYGAYVAAHDVTRDNVAAHARALAVLAYPREATVQKAPDGSRTVFGNAVQAAGAGLRAHLTKAEAGPVVVTLITRAGASATLAEVTAAWEAAQV